MFYRRKIILALLQAFEGNLPKISLQKLLFLFASRQSKQDYEFVSGYYDYRNKSLKDTQIFYKGDMIAVVAYTMAADLTLSFV